MPDRLTPEQLQEIEARVNAATPGPWMHTPGVAIKDYISSENKDLSFSLQQLHWEDGRETNATNNAAFIAAARADIPALLAEIKALRQERDEAATAEVFTPEQILHLHKCVAGLDTTTHVPLAEIPTIPYTQLSGAPAMPKPGAPPDAAEEAATS